ncbi:hypothetical protein GQ44DRAFT_685066 [Phaeosphaeriaceae sp. PMI808]|nr:hypothetical protein GQ44DRAFT_685066 [Phaeosphaeriaceae sp. PMI808]
MTRKSSVHSVLAKSDTPSPPNKANDGRPMAPSTSGVTDTISNTKDTNEEIVRLQVTLTDLKTAYKAKEILLRRTREELKNARETLNDTFAEYSKLRDDMKTIKQNMSRDHQAVVYRKDIELFALRKGNEQKEKYIMEHDAKLEEVFQQQRATVELKDAQLKILKERLTRLDCQSSPKFGHGYEESMEGDQALEVRLLRVKRKSVTDAEDRSATRPESLSADEDTIASLREQLVIAKKATEEFVNQQAELQRAWEITRKVQETLKGERALHVQTREQLQELAIKFEEQQRDRINSTARLPTIEEDKDELEAMFDTAQEDNVRLHTQLHVLEKRLHDANARIFATQEEAEALRAQLRLEKAISDDLETARPSVVHRVHFQRMENQLKESRDALVAKIEEIESMKKTIAGKDCYVKDLQAEVDAAVSFHTQDQDEIERLKKIVNELQATKDQLMLDRERIALQRPRLRISSTERTSARSSGATLTQGLSPPLTSPSNEPPPTEPLPTPPPAVDASNDSIKQTPNRRSLISNDAPPPEPRALKRRSLGFRDLVKKIVKKDTKSDPVLETAQTDGTEVIERPRSKAAVLATTNPEPIIRPNTAAPEVGGQTPFNSDPPVLIQQAVRPPTARSQTPRYYAEQAQNEEERPKTAVTSATSANRRSWGTVNKLKRRSLY